MHDRQNNFVSSSLFELKIAGLGRNAPLKRSQTQPSQRRDVHQQLSAISTRTELRRERRRKRWRKIVRIMFVRGLHLPLCLNRSAIKSIRNRKSIPFRFFSSAKITPIVVRMFTPGTLPLFRQSSLRQDQQSASSFVNFPPAPRSGDRKSLDRGEVGFRHLFFAATRALRKCPILWNWSGDK